MKEAKIAKEQYLQGKSIDDLKKLNKFVNKMKAKSSVNKNVKRSKKKQEDDF